jgi:hypothetical protein
MRLLSVLAVSCQCAAAYCQTQTIYDASSRSILGVQGASLYGRPLRVPFRIGKLTLHPTLGTFRLMGFLGATAAKGTPTGGFEAGLFVGPLGFGWLYRLEDGRRGHGAGFAGLTVVVR